jgi:catechol 2,3-dioxygenase-like lactoylglutathione lyase family enzyme
MSGFSFSNTTLLLFQLGSTASDSHMPNNAGTIPGHGPSQQILELLVPPTTTSSSSAANSSSSSPDSTSNVDTNLPSSSPQLHTLKQHFCLAVPNVADVRSWEEWFKSKNVPITGTVDWPRGGRSVYFADLDGNVGEVASRGIWGHY